MGNTPENKPEKYISIGLLAHVDAGKTTLAESILYQSGKIRKPGRVDHGNAYLDTYELERSRGITIFSKQAKLALGDWDMILLDTPGHVDFSAEMERTLQILDYAILVISGADGVQGHVRTLWRLLSCYKVPVFLFVNKMDQEGTDHQKLLEELKHKLDERCVDFTKEQQDSLWEEMAVCSEELLESYLEKGFLETGEIAAQIGARNIFPCYFGSALKMVGVEEFLKGISCYSQCPEYPREFGAKIYKISRDAQGNRLTHMKITGGCLKVKMPLSGISGGEAWEEKADQIRVYSGASFETVEKAPAGAVCAVTGLTHTRPGDGLGRETKGREPLLEPVLAYQVLLPGDCDVHEMLRKLRRLEEELPELHIVWKEQTGEIHVQVMGKVQLEILRNLIQERFGLSVEFGPGSIVYKETIENVVEGVGHFEPLRHYAEVHLLLEPGEPGSGLVFETTCSEDVLDRNWQRLILTHLEEKRHLGVLTGSELTDVKITLAAGKAHLKHTEGGDFREATYRAVRQGLKQAKSVLLEPFYEFRLEIPTDKVGRAMSDIQKMSGSFSEPMQEGGMAILTGSAPVSAMQEYQSEVHAYTRGTGRLSCTLKGYGPCHNAGEVIEAIGYNSEQDVENPTGSVFCTHGAGYYVSWDQVPSHMHLESVWKTTDSDVSKSIMGETRTSEREKTSGWADEKELEEIFVRTYGPIRRDRQGVGRVERAFRSEPEVPLAYRKKSQKSEKEYLLVDGYNIIFAWESLKELAEVNLEAARGKLMDILCNLQGYRKCTLILVFDAYRVEGNRGEVLKYHNIHVVYTKEAETADQYIEKVAHELGRKYQVTVATSDALEQVIILGQGARRLSAQGLLEEVESVNEEIRDSFLSQYQGNRQYLLENLPEELAKFMEDVRLGKKSFH
ncbi:MAG: GTP-binding protein [Lachnospiraceae bacterium]|nr:GTP-binding protein [Lachnospiraceae bacterium]